MPTPKSILLSLTTGLLLACATARSSVPTAAQFAPAEAQIRSVLSTQAAAWNRGDLPAYMEGYWHSDSLLFIGKNGPQRGWQRTLDNYRRSYSTATAMGQLDFSQLQITPLSAAAAHVVGHWHLARPQAGDLQGWFTLLFRKIDGKWVIVTDHSS